MTTISTDTQLAAELTAGSIRLVGVSKAYNPKQPGQKAVDTISLDIEAGTFVTFLGPSGCGKTTTLRMIAGFEDPTEGDIQLDGESMVHITPDKRPMSMVFQSYALFPHLTVRDNILFGLKIKNLSKAARNLRADEGLTMMGIEQYADRYPHQLSGGQQQRVALARALVMEPKIVLFDEPLSNLDARLRVRMRDEIRALQQRLGLTAIFVTHDQSEALTMSDVIVVMSAGLIEQVGAPTEIYRHPANRFVAQFLGTSNFIDGVVSQVESAKQQEAPARYNIETDFGGFTVAGVEGLTAGERVSLVIRAEDLTICTPGQTQIPGTVEAVAFDGSVVNYQVKTAVGTLKGEAPGASTLYTQGDTVSLEISPSSLWAISHSEVTN